MAMSMATTLTPQALLRLFAQQEQLADTVSAQALALAALPVAASSAIVAGTPSTAESADARFSTEKLVEVAASLRRRQRDLASWLEQVAADARTQREQLAVERQALVESIAAANGNCSTLSALASELHATQRDVASHLTELMSGEEGAVDGSQRAPAAGGEKALAGGAGSSDGGGSSSDACLSSNGGAGELVRLNVGGQRFCTTLATLRAEDSMLSAMFSGRFDVRTEEDGAVFIDRDGTHFRHVLNHLRGAGLHVGKDMKVLLALRDEADFYLIPSLQELLRSELSRLEDKGERLKQIAIDSAIEHTRGVFDDLLGVIYTEVESQAARGKRVVVIGFTQEKLVKGVRYRSQESDFWDAKILNAQYHRLLASIPNQQLLVDRLGEQGLKAHVKPLSVNVPVGDAAVAMQWVSTTTLLLTLTIWEVWAHRAQRTRASRPPRGLRAPRARATAEQPAWAPQASASPHAPSSTSDACGGHAASAASALRPPTLLRSASDMRSTSEWSEVAASTGEPDSPSYRESSAVMATVHRRTLNTAWGRPGATDEPLAP